MMTIEADSAVPGRSHPTDREAERVMRNRGLSVGTRIRLDTVMPTVRRRFAVERARIFENRQEARGQPVAVLCRRRRRHAGADGREPQPA